jgi:hypothetical protein
MSRVGRVSLKDKQIQIARIGIESVIAHCIAQNIKIDPGFPVHWYISECEAVLKKTYIPDYLIIDILDEAEDKGINEEPPVSGGASQLHPESNNQLIEAINKLNKLFLEVK